MITSKDYPCKFCMNAKSYIPTEEELLSGNILNDNNDSSSISIGHAMKYHRILLSSGDNKPVRIEIDTLCTIDHEHSEWITHSIYYPKFCPECGRELREYKISERGANFERKI